jgi:hypothetical protein
MLAARAGSGALGFVPHRHRAQASFATPAACCMVGWTRWRACNWITPPGSPEPEHPRLQAADDQGRANPHRDVLRGGAQGVRCVLRAKHVGEPPISAPAPAIASAVYKAVGVQIDVLAILRQKIFAARRQS